MDKQLNVPVRRIGQFQLSQEPFKPTQLKESTHRRLTIAKQEFYNKPAYQIIEEALEMFYANTDVDNFRNAGLLLDIVNLQDAAQED